MFVGGQPAPLAKTAEIFAVRQEAHDLLG